MIAARRKLYGLTGFDGKTFIELTHRHHAIVHGHLVQLDFIGNVSRASHQPVRRGALVLDA